MKIARVFPSKNHATPNDEHCYFTGPTMMAVQEKYDEVCISTSFDWDLPVATELKQQWQNYYGDKVKVGGPALDDPGSEFVPGKFLRNGYIITSRGCPNNCPFCFVPEREGQIRELEVKEGNIVQDNNLLACSQPHLDKVWQMLSKQNHIDFSGGFESSRITDEVIDRLRSLKVYQMWLAYDHDGAYKHLEKAVNKLSKYFKRDKIRCYVLIGFKDDTIEKAEQRLTKAWDLGTLPFAMLYKPKVYTKDWHQFQRTWTRPAIIRSMMKEENRNERNFLHSDN